MLPIRDIKRRTSSSKLNKNDNEYSSDEDGDNSIGDDSVNSMLDHYIDDSDKDNEVNNYKNNDTRTTVAAANFTNNVNSSNNDEPSDAHHAHNSQHAHHRHHSHRSHQNKHYQLPSVNATIPLFFRIPQLLPGFIFKRRLHDMIYFGGDEVKQGLIEEMSIHILIDSLFFTITVSPIYQQVLPVTCYTYICRLSIILTYIVFNVQLWTISLHAIILFALVEVPSIACKEWMSRRESAIYVVGRLHVMGLYLFVLNFFLWPIANYDTFYQIVCTITSLSTWLFVFYFTGTTVTNGIFDSLNPAIKLRGKPKNEEIRRIAESDFKLFKQLERPSLPTNVNEFLIDLNLFHLKPIFEEANIDMHLLQHLDHTDYRNMKISIGERIIIQQAIHHCHH